LGSRGLGQWCQLPRKLVQGLQAATPWRLGYTRPKSYHNYHVDVLAMEDV
jgi:hypothetical protein